MNVDSIIVSDYATVSQDGKLTVVGAFNRIGAQSFPALHAILSVSLIIHGHHAEGPPNEHTLTLRLLNERREQIGQAVERSFQFTEHPFKALPLRFMVAQRFIPVVFEKPGLYAFEAHINGTYAATASFLVEET